MNGLKAALALILFATISACTSTIDDPSVQQFREVPEAEVAETKDTATRYLEPVYRVRNINVDVPLSLEVSERNSYYPGADIVWRGDPIGNRHEQVKAIFEAGFARGARDIRGSVPVDLDVRVERFHALTERARYTIGGVHAITFVMQVRDARTGDLLGEPKRVRADLDGYGGSAALRAEQAGLTQKVRITSHLAEVLRQEFMRPGGHAVARLGVVQAINTL